jgi:4-amino-4-deoxy-L-arabinose transferase-like glycosyltransferase
VSRRFRWSLLAISCAGGFVRLFRLDHFSYGLDEILQAYWIHGSWRFFWGSLRYDAFHPPLDYLVGRLVETLHPADWARKLPAVVWGVGTAWTLAVLLARRAGEAAGLCAAALLALAPFHVRYSQELRPYSLSLLLLCLSLLCLDLWLEKPGAGRLLALFLACLATAYTLYTAAFVLAIAGAALLAEDALTGTPERRRAARGFLAWSPAFLLALWLCYLPWWPVFLEAARRPAMAAPAPRTLSRLGRVLSYFAFAPDDGEPLGAMGTAFVILAAAGAGVALSRRRLRFLVAWGPGGLLAIEVLGRLHPHFDVSRRFLPAGIALPALAALPLAEALARRAWRFAGAVALAALLSADAYGLREYFRRGRADWRTLAGYLKQNARPGEKIFTENQYAQLCTAFYLEGPQWLEQVLRGGKPFWDFPNLEGEIVRLTWSWAPGTRAWLVLAGEPVHESLRRWGRSLPHREFPAAERAVLVSLEPERRESALAAAR